MLKQLRFTLIVLLTSSSLFGENFHLSQISDVFPSEGLEPQVHFWTQLFGHYGERDIVFHDRNDLRIIYSVETFDRGILNDDAEAERQSTILKSVKDELYEQLGLLAEAGEGTTLSPGQVQIQAQLLGLGYQPDSQLYRQLQENIRYQRGLKERFQEGIVRSGKYFEAMQKVFQSEGLPAELALLPHVESAFKYYARSKAGAVGLWQFVPGTGRQYMTVGRDIDERLDPVKSTRAAASFLKENYQALGNWPLAITAYNHGRYGMLRAKKQHGSDLRDILKNYESRLFGFASKNFYAEFLAAVNIVANRDLHFGAFQVDPPMAYETLALNKSVHLDQFLKAEGLSEEVLREYNPFLTRAVWNRKILPAQINLRLPIGSSATVARILAEAPASKMGDDQPLGPGGLLQYRVQKGDTLAAISQRFKTSVAAVIRANQIDNRHRIYPGQRLLIPPATGSDRPTRYRVKSGDTLIEIAQRFTTSVENILLANGMRNANQIMMGQVLLIP